MFLISFENVLSYLFQHQLIQQDERHSHEIEQLDNCKNFNLLVHLSNDRCLLVKQECHDGEGHTMGEFWNEWQVHELLHHFPELEPLQSLVSVPIYFDVNSSILVFNYLGHYSDLRNYYTETNTFSIEILGAIGAVLATLHRTTIDRQAHKDFLKLSLNGATIDKIPNFSLGLRYVGPEVFSSICADGIEFLKLYQRHTDLDHAIEQINVAFEPCCLIHNDLRLSNILLHSQKMSNKGNPSQESLIRLIDWECCQWGDPAFDLGALVAGYLELWLESLVVSKAISLDTALRLATIPLEKLQPSLIELIRAYQENFPEILSRYPTFLCRVMQFAGVNLIQKIQAKIEHHQPFDNRCICMLQVAKSILSTPEQSILSVFGVPVNELIKSRAIAS